MNQIENFSKKRNIEHLFFDLQYGVFTYFLEIKIWQIHHNGKRPWKSNALEEEIQKLYSKYWGENIYLRCTEIS